MAHICRKYSCLYTTMRNLGLKIPQEEENFLEKFFLQGRDLVEGIPRQEKYARTHTIRVWDGTIGCN